MKILISTDTSCVLNYELLKKNNISVFPLNVIIDGIEFLDGVTITQEDLAKEMRAKKVIKTSTPPIGQIVEYFENKFNEGYDYIIHFTISSKLSSMSQLFENVSEEYFSGKIKIIDSFALSAQMLSLVLYTKDAIENNLSIDEITKKLDERKNDHHIFFVPENLTALKNGGRVSPFICAIGNTIGLKPILSLQNGELIKISTTRKPKADFKELIDQALEEYPIEEYDFTIVGFDCDEFFYNYLKNHFIEKIGEDKLIEGKVPINVCAHCGPGTFGFLATKKINGKSIKDFM